VGVLHVRGQPGHVEEQLVEAARGVGPQDLRGLGGQVGLAVGQGEHRTQGGHARLLRDAPGDQRLELGQSPLLPADCGHLVGIEHHRVGLLALGAHGDGLLREQLRLLEPAVHDGHARSILEGHPQRGGVAQALRQSLLALDRALGLLQSPSLQQRRAPPAQRAKLCRAVAKLVGEGDVLRRVAQALVEVLGRAPDGDACSEHETEGRWVADPASHGQRLVAERDAPLEVCRREVKLRT